MEAAPLRAWALEGLPEIRPGDDLAEQIAAAGRGRGEAWGIREDDVVVIAHKAVSKAEGRLRKLSQVQPGARALELAHRHDKDARHVQVVLDETQELLRASHGVLICVTKQGFVCANAGVDASNATDHETLILLPSDPDASARSLRAGLRAALEVKPAVVITDSFGRAWRHGQCDVAIGVAGIAPLEDWRGRTDAVGRELRATWVAVADQLAAMADLARAKDSWQPVVVIRGTGRLVTAEDGPGAAAMIRPKESDLFR